MAALQPSIERTEVWAQLILSSQDQERVREFMTTVVGVKRRLVTANMHLTVYHARRPMPGLEKTNEQVNVIIPAADFRFMVMAPGGENPRPELDPAKRKVGVRVIRSSSATPEIQAFRQRLLDHETVAVLGRRKPSTRQRNAFGARNFQPHMSVLRPGTSIDRDLRLIGKPFRETLGELVFDRFIIEIAKKSGASQAQQGLAVRRPRLRRGRG